MNYTAADTQAACTPETNTLLMILQAVIADGSCRSLAADDLKGRAESAARAFRAGLAAFTAPASLGSVGAKGSGGGTTSNDAFDKNPAQKQSSHDASIVCMGRGLKEECRCSLPFFIRF